MGEGGSYYPIANTPPPSMGYNLRAFGINCLGVQGEQEGEREEGTTSLGSAKIPKSRKEDFSTSRHSHLDARSPKAAPGTENGHREGGGGARQPLTAPGLHRHTQTDVRTGSQLAPGGRWPATEEKGERRPGP